MSIDKKENQKEDILTGVSNLSQKILEEEKEILKEIKKEESEIKKLSRNAKITFGLIAFLIIALSSGFAYWKNASNYIYTDKAEINAPTTALAPQNPGILQEVFVNQGDLVNENAVVARVDSELIKTKTQSLVVGIENNIGKIFNRGEAVVTVINPDDLRAIAHIDENKGLNEIKIGQSAVFTVDTFGSRKYEGVVDEISPSSRQGDVVFNISDKRETRVFDIKIRFDTKKYPELKNGMSAKIWIYKN